MKFNRRGGILLHPTSLPGPYGIGDLGKSAFQWVDWLAGTGCKLWQILPLGPTGFGDSPYQCFSAFAGNPYLISPQILMEQGLLNRYDFTDMPAWDERLVDFGTLYRWKPALLENACTRFFSSPSKALTKDYEGFLQENSSWLEDYALFMALKEHHGGGPWDLWPESLRKRDPVELKKMRESLKESISRTSFLQFLFFTQWHALKNYANQKGIQILGDIPIFVAYDSSDVWANQHLFSLDDDGRPLFVAGVPPDYFSPTGQLWGNPLYKWEVHKASGYGWWRERMRSIFSLVDYVRVDHFRGFAAYWEIPFGSPTAETGRWVQGPGADVFLSMQKNLSPGGEELPIIAEDLGLITPDVISLRDQLGYPGMKVLQFAFSGPDNIFLPHYYPENCVVYTGTHDNDTSRGWFESAPTAEKEFACKYLKVDGSDFAWDLIRAAWKSNAVFAIAPMQDFLNLDSTSRMNIPSTLGGRNWGWRMLKSDMGEELQKMILKTTQDSNR